MPVGLVEIVSRRLARLGEAVDVLHVAAVVGQSFDVAVVEETVALGAERNGSSSGASDVLALLERARDAGVVVDDDDGMSFRHAVIRGALLDPVSAARRQRLHRDIATILERRWSPTLDRHVEALAHHHDRARSPDAPRWYLRAASAAVDALDAHRHRAGRARPAAAGGGRPSPPTRS